MVVDLEISFDRFPYPEIYKKGTVKISIFKNVKINYFM